MVKQASFFLFLFFTSIHTIILSFLGCVEFLGNSDAVIDAKTHYKNNKH